MLQALAGLLSCWRASTPLLAQTLRPSGTYTLLRKGQQWVWQELHQWAFEEANKAVRQVPAFGICDPTLSPWSTGCTCGPGRDVTGSLAIAWEAPHSNRILVAGMERG